MNFTLLAVKERIYRWRQDTIDEIYRKVSKPRYVGYYENKLLQRKRELDEEKIAWCRAVKEYKQRVKEMQKRK